MCQADEMFNFLLKLAKVSSAISKSEGHVRFGVDGAGEFQILIAFRSFGLGLIAGCSGLQMAR